MIINKLDIANFMPNGIGHLHARVPRIKRDDGKVRLIPTPWEGKVSGFTLLFEALLIQLCKAMPVHNVSDLTGVSDHKI